MPRELCGWQHRWDDPLRRYRTLYCADSRLTCLREVLADLRPNAKTLAELRELFGDAGSALRFAGQVRGEWRDEHVLARARMVTEDAFCDLDADVVVRLELERDLAALLAEHAMDHLDVGEVRSRDRVVTQAVSRMLFERGYAGVRFGSNLDDEPCYALFEGRAELLGVGEVVALTPGLAVLREVCAELGLRLM